MDFRPAFLFLFLPLVALYAEGKRDNFKDSLLMLEEFSEYGSDAKTAGGLLSAAGEADDRAEMIVRAFANAYPDRIEKAEFLGGEWTILVYGERFYYSGGRFLPVFLKDKSSEYSPQPFYNYQKELPPWVQLSAEESERMKEQEALRRTRQLKRSPHLYDALWRAHNKDEAWEHIKQIRFLGLPVQVHYSILIELSLVEETILRAAKTNPAVRQWIGNLSNVEGWEWRNIASSQNRSFHAYGAAVDLLPKSYGGLETYWLWTSRTYPEWWNVPYSKRFHPPQEVINAFESFGFVWGGKWRYFDTMHFEYRPEILELSGLKRIDKRELR
jgi:hypothetical protein